MHLPKTQGSTLVPTPCYLEETKAMTAQHSSIGIKGNDADLSRDERGVANPWLGVANPWAGVANPWPGVANPKPAVMRHT